MDYAYCGTIMAFAGNYAPLGWGICDGRLVRVNDYPALFALIGTTYGGDGVTNFALPNLIQRVVVGEGQGPGLSKRELSKTGGFNEVTLSVNHIPPHTHTFRVSNSVGTLTSPTPGCTLSALDQTNISFYDNIEGANLTTMNQASVSVDFGGGAPHDNRMPYQEVTYIICMEGEWPVFE